MPFIAIYDWSLYSLPSAIPMADILNDTHSNHPDTAAYNPSAPSWIGESFTFNGGSSVLLDINDDDAFFEDGYVETGAPQTLAQDVVINGTTYTAGSVVENEFSMLDASGNEIFVVRIGGVNVGFSYPAGMDPIAGDTFVGVDGRDGSATDSSDGISGSTEPYVGVICFTPGALIQTPRGPQPVETLRVGDLVRTVDNGDQAIRWISRRRVEFNDGVENAKPVQIKADAFADGIPKRDIIVSPQHRFLFREHGTRQSDEVFVAAKALTVLRGVRVMKGKRVVEYIHFALSRHEIVLAEGAATESCYLGPVMLQDFAPSQRRRIKAIFPQIEFDPCRGYGPTARPELRVNRARNMLKSGRLSYGMAQCDTLATPRAAVARMQA